MAKGPTPMTTEVIVDPMARFRDFLDSQIPMMCKDANIAADNIEEFVKEHESDIRRDERRRVAALLEENAPTVVGFVKDPTKAVALIAFLLRLDP